MARNRFDDPNNVRPSYDWPVNHTTEDENGKKRTITTGALTGDDTGLVKQQADSDPMMLRWQGTIFHEAQLDEMIAWWQLCETQTVLLTDFAGDTYEVIITTFNPVRKSTVRNPRDFANAPYWYWTYTFEAQVVTIVDGPWSGVTP